MKVALTEVLRKYFGRFIGRYAYQFVTNRAYRSYIFQMLRERSAPRVNSGTFRLSEINDFSDLKGKKLFMCGGCELTFVADHLTASGLDVYHTFQYGRTADAMVEANDPQSSLFTSRYDAIVICQTQSFMQLLNKIVHDGGKYMEEERQNDFETLLLQLRFAVERIATKQQCPLFVVSHFYINTKYRGTHEYKSSPNLTSIEELYLKYTLALYEFVKGYPNTYVLDANEIFEIGGKRNSLEIGSRNGVFDHPTKIGSQLIAEETMYQLKALNPKAKRIKCAVFDLDNTLWRGVLREDGVANLYPYWSHLSMMSALASRGILLALCSKNDPEEEKFVRQILGDELFDQIVCMKLNWNAKSTNLKQIAQELNIGLDSVAFFDDNPMEREEVQMNAPGVMVFAETDINDTGDMTVFEPIGAVTEESAARTQMYKEQAKRAAAESTADPANLTEFYKSCAFKLDLRRAEPAAIPRIEELIQRTNQLNATGKRTQRDELQRYIADPSRYYVVTAALKDKFGDYGLIGVCIAGQNGSDWDVIEFDFSCRAMGKSVERALLSHMCQTIRDSGGDAVTVRFNKTSRNHEINEILKDFGFSAMEVTDEQVLLRLQLDRESYPYPEWFEIQTDAETVSASKRRLGKH
jgi:FkbH-like protein